jgi:hypothetical protein
MHKVLVSWKTSFDNILPRRKCFATNYGTVSSSINIGHTYSTDVREYGTQEKR